MFFPWNRIIIRYFLLFYNTEEQSDLLCIAYS